MKFSIPQSPIYKELVPFLPEEGEYDESSSTYTVHHRVYTVPEWIQRHTIHECIVTYEMIVMTCASISNAVSLAPVFSENDIRILDTGSVLWIPHKFTSSMEPDENASTHWMAQLSIYLQSSLLNSRKNHIQSKTLREFLGSIPLTYTLERMTYNMPYASIV